MGRRIIVADRLDLHLVWENDGKMYLKPLPGLLLDGAFWMTNLDCPASCPCVQQQHPYVQGSHSSRLITVGNCKKALREIALGFIYTYVCLICSELDFEIANEMRILPRTRKGSELTWVGWKELAREVLQAHGSRHVSDKVHPRFHRGELRLSRINFIHRMRNPLATQSYFGGWKNYSSSLRDNLTWMATAAIFIALALTAMQVGLATDRLQKSIAFQRASVGFTVFAILGPLCISGIVALWALFNLATDLSWVCEVEEWKRNA